MSIGPLFKRNLTSLLRQVVFKGKCRPVSTGWAFKSLHFGSDIGGRHRSPANFETLKDLYMAGLLKRVWSFAKGAAAGTGPICSGARQIGGHDYEVRGFRDMTMDAAKFNYPVVLSVASEGEEFIIVLPAGHPTIEYLANMASVRCMELEDESIERCMPGWLEDDRNFNGLTSLRPGTVEELGEVGDS